MRFHLNWRNYKYLSFQPHISQPQRADDVRRESNGIISLFRSWTAANTSAVYLRVRLPAAVLQPACRRSSSSSPPWPDSQTGSSGWCGCTGEITSSDEREQAVERGLNEHLWYVCILFLLTYNSSHRLLFLLKPPILHIKVCFSCCKCEKASFVTQWLRCIVGNVGTYNTTAGL